MESPMEIPPKIQDGTSSWPSNSTSLSVSGNPPNPRLKEHMHPRVHGSVSAIAKIRQQRPPSCLMRGGFFLIYMLSIPAPPPIKVHDV